MHMSLGADETLLAHEHLVRERAKPGDTVRLWWGIGPAIDCLCCGWSGDFLRVRISGHGGDRTTKIAPRRVTHINGSAVTDLLAQSQSCDDLQTRMLR